MFVAAGRPGESPGLVVPAPAAGATLAANGYQVSVSFVPVSVILSVSRCGGGSLRSGDRHPFQNVLRDLGMTGGAALFAAHQPVRHAASQHRLYILRDDELAAVE